jgi:predicted helicase
MKMFAILPYVYAVLHHPAYHEKYSINLKREFPRIPVYNNLWQREAWGRQLMDLHPSYETADPCPLKRADLRVDSAKPTL